MYVFFYLSSMRKFFLAVKKMLKLVYEGVSNGQEGVSKWARGAILKSRTKWVILKGPSAHFETPECPFETPEWTFLKFLNSKKKFEHWIKVKINVHIAFFNLWGFLCNLKNITKMKKNFPHFENLFLHFAQQNWCWLAGFFFISQFFFFILKIFFFILQKSQQKRIFRLF